MAIKDGKFFFEPETDLSSAVRMFFSILDSQEVSSNDVTFHPVKMEVGEDGKVVFGSVRVMRTAQLSQLFKEMKELASYGRSSPGS